MKICSISIQHSLDQGLVNGGACPLWGPECKVWQVDQRTAHEKSQCVHRCTLGFAHAQSQAPHAWDALHDINKLICEQAYPHPLIDTSRSELRTRKKCSYLPTSLIMLNKPIHVRPSKNSKAYTRPTVSGFLFAACKDIKTKKSVQQLLGPIRSCTIPPPPLIFHSHV